MKTLAAILVETGKELEIDQIEIPALKAGQVLVEIQYSGVCHTQILEVRGHKGKDNFLPHCLGHEGSGVVREVGAGVTKTKAGQKVLLSWIKGCGQDVPGSVYDWNGKKVNAGAVTTFSQFSVISENRLTPLPEDIKMTEAALLGCAVPTGLGAVFNNANPSPGQSLAVFGVGGVGLCALLGAMISGCSPIIAVDVNPSKLEAAKAAGAKHFINPQNSDLTAELAKICPQGLDFVIEATGRTQMMELALNCVRNLTGIAVVIGNAHAGQRLSLDPKQFNNGKQLRGSWGGGVVPDRDFPKFFTLLQSKKLSLAGLISKTYSLSKINQALADLENGLLMRPLIDMSLN